MDTPELWLLSVSAFTAVMLLLALLAVTIRLLTLAFPAPAVAGGPRTAGPPVAPSAAGPPAGSGATDAAVLVAIHAAAQRVLPGARVSQVEEVR